MRPSAPWWPLLPPFHFTCGSIPRKAEISFSSQLSLAVGQPQTILVFLAYWTHAHEAGGDVFQLMSVAPVTLVCGRVGFDPQPNGAPILVIITACPINGFPLRIIVDKHRICSHCRVLPRPLCARLVSTWRRLLWQLSPCLQESIRVGPYWRVGVRHGRAVGHLHRLLASRRVERQRSGTLRTIIDDTNNTKC